MISFFSELGSGINSLMSTSQMVNVVFSREVLIFVLGASECLIATISLTLRDGDSYLKIEFNDDYSCLKFAFECNYSCLKFAITCIA